MIMKIKQIMMLFINFRLFLTSSCEMMDCFHRKR